jgi:hypothetical protein
MGDDRLQDMSGVASAAHLGTACAPCHRVKFLHRENI